MEHEGELLTLLSKYLTGQISEEVLRAHLDAPDLLVALENLTGKTITLTSSGDWVRVEPATDDAHPRDGADLLAIGPVRLRGHRTVVLGNQTTIDGDVQGPVVSGTVYGDLTIHSTPPAAPAIFQTPHLSLGTAFVERERELKQLASMLRRHDVAVIGPPGIGKSQLAAELTHQYHELFPGGVFWIDMADPAQARQQVAACAGPGGLNLANYTDLDEEARVTATLTAWSQPAARLVVFDGLEEPSLLQQWRPQGGGTRLLLTSRDAMALPGMEVIALQPPTKIDARLRRILVSLHAEWLIVPWLREQALPIRILTGLLSVVTVVSTILGLYWGIRQFFTDVPTSSNVVTALPATSTPVPRMAGGFNIAVASFVSLDAKRRVTNSSVADRFSASITEIITTQVHTLTPQDPAKRIDFAVQKVGSVGGADADAHEETIRQLAQTIDADMIIYGYVISDDTALDIRFYLSPRQLANAEELSGVYDFGPQTLSKTSIEGNPLAREAFEKAVADRAVVLAQFVYGLGYFAEDRYSEALPLLKSVEQNANWGDSNRGKEVFYLFLGNTFARLGRGHIQEAQTYYERALAIDNKYSRARLGLAETQFQQLISKYECSEAPEDIKGLRQSFENYGAALETAKPDDKANIVLKTDLYQGRVATCLHIAGEPNVWGLAKDYFRKVIFTYENDITNKSLEDLASEAYADLGYLAFYPPASGEGISDSDAADYFNKAIHLSKHDQRLAIFNIQIARLYLRLDRCSDADAAAALSHTLSSSISDADSIKNYNDIHNTYLSERTSDIARGAIQCSAQATPQES